VGSFSCALPHELGKLVYTGGPAFEGTQLDPAVFYRPDRAVPADAGLQLFESLWFEVQASRRLGLRQWYVAFLAETGCRGCFKGSLKPFLTYSENNTCRRLIIIFIFSHNIFSRKGVWGNTKSYCLQ
jgi:hypothetical protein